MPMVVAEDNLIPEQVRFRKPRTQTRPISTPDPIPSLLHSTRSKPTISSLLLTPFSPTSATSDQPTSAASPTVPKKKNFTSATFRGLGCTASSQVSVPSVIRTSADWDSKKVKKKKLRSKKNKLPDSDSAIGGAGNGNGGSTSGNQNNPLTSSALSSNCVAIPDVWCGPGIGFTTDAASDCVVSRRPVSGRGKLDADRIIHRERPSSMRRMVTPEDFSGFDPDSGLGMSRTRLDISGSRYHRHIRHGLQEGLAEIVMLQGSLILGGRPDGHDRYRDWRLDVDNMSYEELLELGDRIGYVSTGLGEDEISRCLRRIKHGISDKPSPLRTDVEKKCSICQEEYEADDDIGKLDCGHYFHSLCVKQWLSQKNCCPICKTTVMSQF